MQPTYLPWLGYFSLINSADKFVFLDNVKLEKSDWHVRNKIKSGRQE
ncbi:WbqC family protein, partial [Staphylococcus pasteuri_A]